jgi:hypothetical protein
MTKRVFLEFIGGSWDGMNLCSDSPDPAEVGLASLTFAKTHDATIGSAVVMPSDYAVRKTDLHGYKYVVQYRTELGDEVLVRLECCWNEPAEPCVCMGKRIVLEFRGGHLHGRRLDSQSAETNEALLALAYYCVTNQGTVGKKINGKPVTPLLPKSRSNGSTRDGEYGVTQRLEDDERVCVTFDCHSTNRDVS